MQYDFRKILIIRFSSIGDVLQSLSIASAIQNQFPQAEIHWLTRSDMTQLIETHPAIKKVWQFDRSQGFLGLLRMARDLRNENFDFIYDAHNNARSLLTSWILRPFGIGPMLLRRSLYRWKRFLLFRFRINFFQMPFSGQRDLLIPLEKINIAFKLPNTPQYFIKESSYKKARELMLGFENAITLAPSAAHLLKRWPIEHWIRLIELLPNHKFILLGGPEDRFLHDIQIHFSDRILNLAGRASLAVSAAVVDLSPLLISNDTGLMHVAEQRGIKCIALMGPAPFGFPCRPTTQIMQLDLACRPCSKHGQGPCKNSQFHQCLVGIEPQMVKNEVSRLLAL